MGKFTAIQTFDRFQRLLNAEQIDQHSLNFILDTGLLYTHGIFINGAAYGTEANNAIELTIAGTTKTLSLSSHTHSNYLEKNSNIDIGTYKIVSGNNDLLYYSTNVYVGDTDVPLILLSSNPVLVARDSHTYTVLDTGNFSVTSTYPNGTVANGIYALIKYGSSSFPIEYVGRVNAFGSTFDTLSYLTSAGTTNLNNTLYGFITLRTDGTSNNPSWAQIRINIPDRTFEFRTSSSTNTWNSLVYKTNALNVAGIVSAPTASNANMVWKTDASGNPGWRSDTNTWRNIRINDDTSDKLSTSTSSGVLTILQGDGIGVKWENDKLVIENTAVDIDHNVTTSAVVASSASLTAHISSNLSNPYYNLLEGGAVTRSIQFKSGLGISIEAATNGVITFSSINSTTDSTLTGVSLSSNWLDVDSLNSKLTLGNGSYMIQITYASCIYTGVFSYIQGGMVDDEIILHCSGTIDSVGGVNRGRLFAKIGTTSGTTYLRLATSLDESNATLTIKYRKLI